MGRAPLTFTHSRQRRNGIAVLVVIVWLIHVACPVISQDLVVVRGSDQATISRRGTIIDWRGGTLKLETQQRERAIDNDDIVSFQTVWPASFQEAQQAISQGQLEVSVSKLMLAIQEEVRPWAKRHIRAELVRVLTALNQWEAAIEHFQLISLEDPETQYFYLCPLKWLGNANLPAPTAAALMKSGDPLRQLMGASWSIPGREQEAATKVLEQLTADLDTRIQKLATTQLWRVRAMNLGSINERQVEVWENRLSELPEKLRAGPWLLIADVQMKLKQHDSALINWMRIPILYPDQYGLSAAALYQSSQLLADLGRAEESQTLRTELQQKYGDTVWAKQLSPVPGR